MIKNNFTNIVVDNFDEICENFKIGLKKKGYEYIPDLINDSFVSCEKALHGKNMTKSEAMKYYWTSYVNKYKDYVIRNNRNVYLDDWEEVDREDEKYNESIDRIYDIIINAVRDKFGIRKAYIWEMYVCKGMSTKELRTKGLGVDNFVYLTRQVKRYILNHLVKENQELKELIECYKND